MPRPLAGLDGGRHGAHGRARRRCCAAPAGSRPARPRARRRRARPPTAGGRAASRSRAARAGRWPARPAAQRAGSEQAGLARPRRTLVGLRNPGGTHGLDPTRAARRLPPPVSRATLRCAAMPNPSPRRRRQPDALSGVGVGGRAHARHPRRAGVDDRLRRGHRRSMDRLVDTRERGYVCAAPVHALMVARGRPGDARRPARLDARGARRHAARLGGEPAGREPRRPRLRARADAALQRALRRARATASGSTAAATRARSSSSRCRCAAAHPGIQIVGGYSPPFRALSARGGALVVDADQRRPSRTCSGSASVCPSRRSGWRACAIASRCR